MGDYASETREAVRAWRIQLTNERRLVQLQCNTLNLWNYLIDIDYHRPYHMMGVRYSATVQDEDAAPITDIHHVPTDGQQTHGMRSAAAFGVVGRSYVLNVPKTELHCIMRAVPDEGGNRPLRLPSAQMRLEMAAIDEELADLDALEAALVDCAPGGKEYRLAVRRASNGGMGRYALRPHPKKRSRVAA